MSNTISILTPVKNEAQFIGYGVMSVLDYVDEIVYADGNSTDGTLEILQHIKKRYDHKDKIKLCINKDCRNLQKDYERLFNFLLGKCKSDYVWFLHPDMLVTNPHEIREGLNDGLRYGINVRSVAGEHYNREIVSGRGGTWNNIYRNDYGIHYAGYYGSADEDFYFRDITGSSHDPYDIIYPKPYVSRLTDIEVYHFCECKPYERRYEKMCKILRTVFPHLKEEDVVKNAKVHPRVTLKNGTFNGAEFKFKKHGNLLHSLPVWKQYHEEFEKLRKGV